MVQIFLGILLCFVFGVTNAAIDKGKNLNDFPFAVAIYKNSYQHRDDDEAICTGSIIGKRWILTAAHCVYDFDSHRIVRATERTIGVGKDAAKKTSAEKIIAVERIFIFNNKRDDQFTRDVALLKISTATQIIPVALPESENAFPNLKSGNQFALAVGYGEKKSMFPPGYRTRVYLNSGDEIIQSDQEIKNLLKKYKKLEHLRNYVDDPVYNSDTMLGATAIEGIPPAPHDSGGPLIITSSEKKFTQIGVISWGLPPNSVAYKNGYMKKEPGIYANLTNKETLAFIKKTMKEYS